jgi:hypothetical protein
MLDCFRRWINWFKPEPKEDVLSHAQFKIIDDLITAKLKSIIKLE